MNTFDILLENTRLHLIFGSLGAFVLFAWLVHRIIASRDRAEWLRAKALEEADTPKPDRAKPGGSTGHMTPVQAVLEVARENRKIEWYEPYPAEDFAIRIWEISRLFNPQYQSEWIWENTTRELLEICDFIEGLGCHDIAMRLRDFAPYQDWVHSYIERDQNPPDTSPEIDLYSKQSEWLEETNAWQEVLDRANAQLSKTYPWADDGALSGELPR